MNKDIKKGRVPRLRFPEFRDARGWQTKQLGDMAALITEKAGSKSYTLMSVTAGIGLVTQVEKFGKEIAGESYKNYYVIKKGDFAYNKSSTKQHPEGQMALLENIEQGAVPNSIFTCFRVNKSHVSPYFLKYPFASNIHGNWLRNFIAVGARANGALNVDTKDLLTLPIVCPTLDEQQKIADCLASIDALISAQSQKVEALKIHKKGLMQRLFPREGETIPRIRFPAFRDTGGWVEKSFEKIIKINSGKGFKASEYKKSGIRLLQIENVGYGVTIWNENAIYLPESYIVEYPELRLRNGDIVLALNRPVTNGELKIAKIQKADEPSILYQRVGKLEVLANSLKVEFAFHICSQFIKNFVIKKSIGSDQPFISLKDLYAQSILIPSPNEQQKIADSLTSIEMQITAQTQKLESLKTHKKGLMQALFPAPDEVEA